MPKAASLLRRKVVVALGLILAAPLIGDVPPAGERSLLIDDFERGLRRGWEVKRFNGETVYKVVPEGAGHALKAESKAAAAGLLFKLDYAVDTYPILTWRWKVENTIRRGDETRKSGDDYAARIYVVFPHWFSPKTRSLNYIWAIRLPKGAHVPNPYFANAIMIAAESGSERVGVWLTERRNVLQDYRRVFGEDPPRAGAVALMTDTDNTGESATAYYDDLRLERE